MNAKISVFVICVEAITITEMMHYYSVPKIRLRDEVDKFNRLS